MKRFFLFLFLELGGVEHSRDHRAPGVAGHEGSDRVAGWTGC